jgi:hypothetical protein
LFCVLGVWDTWTGKVVWVCISCRYFFFLLNAMIQLSCVFERERSQLATPSITRSNFHSTFKIPFSYGRP